MSRRWLAALVVAVAVLIAAPGALAAAQSRIGLNGGRPSEWPILSSVLAAQGLTQQGWLAFASRVGENWLPGTTPVPLNYPGQLGIVSGPNALTADQSTAAGQKLLHALILSELAKGEPVAVSGLSEGTLVIDSELAYLATNPGDAPPRDAVTFYVFGDMLRGLGQMYLRGMSIPFIGQTFGPVPETKYDTVVVNEQWDGWANPPDRPWNLLAVLNAVMGAVYTVNGSNDHSQTSLDSLADAVKVSETTNSLGGKTTTYLIPRQQLPLTRPLRQLGIPDWAVDELDKLLMPLINMGYSSLTPYLGPRIESGRLVFTPPQLPVAAPTVTAQQTTTAQQNVVTAKGSDPAVTGGDAPTSSVSAHRSLTTVTGGSGTADDESAAAGARSDPRVPEGTDVGAPVKGDPVPAVVDPVGSDGADRPDAPTADVEGPTTGTPKVDPGPKDDPEPKPVRQPQPAHVRGASASGPDGDADTDRPERKRPDADAGAPPKDDLQARTTHRPKPSPKNETTGAGAPGPDSTGTAGADSSPSAASAA